MLATDATQTDGTEAATVKAVFEGDGFVFAGVRSCDRQGQLDCGGATRDEKDSGIVATPQSAQPFRELYEYRVGEAAGIESECMQLTGERIDDSWVSVAQVMAIVAMQVEIAPSRVILDVYTARITYAQQRGARTGLTGGSGAVATQNIS